MKIERKALRSVVAVAATITGAFALPTNAAAQPGTKNEEPGTAAKRPHLLSLITTTILLSFVVPLSANTNIMFLDEIYGFEETEGIIYGTGSIGNPASGSTNLCLDIYQPTGTNLPAMRPALVMVHGGGFTGGTKDHGHLTSLGEEFAKRGYVVASIQYRLAGDDPTFEPGPTFGLDPVARSVNAAAQDAAKAIRWLRQNAHTYHVDPSRIGIGGSSAGAITSLYTASQESDTLGPDAEVGVVIDLWGGMSGVESLFDSGDPAVFITHGTLDQTLSVTESENLVAHLESINHPYAYYPLAGAGHGTIGETNGGWARFYSDTVDGKTVFQHSVEFAFKHLNLINLHPAGNPHSSQPTLTLSSTSNELTFSFSTQIGFQYVIQTSDDLITWTSENAASPIAGNNTLRSFTRSTTFGKRFHRIEVSPNF